MATSNHPNNDDDDHVDDDHEQYIDSTDVLAEVPDDGDLPMDDDDEEGEFLVDESGEAGEDMDDVVMEDNSIRHFPNHKGSVFSVSAHPSQPIAASGGEDDLGYIWDVQTGEAIQALTGHTDSVTSTEFSGDGELLATGGMDGKVRVWKRQNREDWKTWEFMIELQGPDEVMVSTHKRIRVFLARA